jgi:plastocyanin
MSTKKAKLPLSKTHPELAKEAYGWDPKTITAGSGKKVKWKCKKGHIYESIIHQRTWQVSNCPTCGNKKILSGFNDLATTHPVLAREAYGWDPKTIGFGSGKKVTWQCKFKHVWKASPNRRTSGNQGKCPICINKIILPGFNDLATTQPNIAKETSKKVAQSVWEGSLKKIDWKCKKGHKWSASPYSRTKSKNNCPICGNKKVLIGFNDLATTHPVLASEAYGWDPKKFTYGSSKKQKWKCKEGHKWSATPGSRSFNKSKCPYCVGHRVIENETDLATKFPKLALRAIGWDPKKVSPFSKKKYLWRCPKGHQYEMAPSNHAIQKQNCPICANKKTLAGFNDLKTLNPKLAKEAYGWDPSTVTVGSGKKLKWQCKKGHIWTTTVSNRSNGTACGICTNRIIEKNYNDLKTKFPAIAKQAHGWDPSKIMAGSSKRVKWRCKKGHIWTTTVVGRVSNNSGCPVCVNQKLLTGYNDLATTYPAFAKEAYGWDPSKVLTGGNKKVAWKCPKGHVYKSLISSRTSQNQGCSICSGRQVLSGFNDVATKFPEIASQAYGWDPKKFTYGSSKKQKWKCANGHTWNAVINSRTTAGQGCPSCSISGFDPNKKGWLYLLEHPVWNMYQVGISNVLEDRLKTHTRLGWEVIDIRGPLEGDVTYHWEQSIIKAIKESGAIFNAERTIGKFTGYSESWNKSTFPVKSIKELMRITEEIEERKGTKK